MEVLETAWEAISHASLMFRGEIWAWNTRLQEVWEQHEQCICTHPPTFSSGGHLEGCVGSWRLYGALNEGQRPTLLSCIPAFKPDCLNTLLGVTNGKVRTVWWNKQGNWGSRRWVPGADGPGAWVWTESFKDPDLHIWPPVPHHRQTFCLEVSLFSNRQKPSQQHTSPLTLSARRLAAHLPRSAAWWCKSWCTRQSLWLQPESYFWLVPT